MDIIQLHLQNKVELQQEGNSVDIMHSGGNTSLQVKDLQCCGTGL
jgi:hypothetical protein